MDTFVLLSSSMDAFVEKEEEIEREDWRHLSARRRRMFCRHLCGGRRARAHYCIINATVPVLQRYFADEDTRPDFRLGREAIQQLLVALKTERQHGWGGHSGDPGVSLLDCQWLRLQSGVFDVPLPSVHRIVHRIVDEVVAVLPHYVRLPRAEDLPGVGEGFAWLAHHQAFGKAAGAIDCCHIQIKCPSGPDGPDYCNRKLFHSVVLQGICDHQGRFVDILWVTQDPCMTHGFLRTAPSTLGGLTLHQETLEVHHEFVPKVVTACVILYNICVGVGDDLPPEDATLEEDNQSPEDATLEEDNQPPAAHQGGGESESGAAWRAALVNLLLLHWTMTILHSAWPWIVLLDGGRGARPPQTALMPHPLGQTRPKSLPWVSRPLCPVLRRDTCIPEQ
ncbi:hypothetical protein JOQ06_021497 [Pogonophryne albipinna]|uniref:DDE Tnp4 domain-containing protein n=1 Tax=Pogonophryne albipinna TaxID=1090488 RepID=A0AAD6AF91_9TELE|nr:hypothetical protein JOQ06_021497 [Pogonophryne albipinna]